MQNLAFAWKIRLSKRAKRARITINTHGVVELVWPHRMSQKHAYAMLKEHEAWVLKHLRQLPKDIEHVIQPPTQIDLKAVDKIWLVKYQTILNTRLSIHMVGNQLEIKGDIKDLDGLRALLCAWVKEQAKQYFQPLLADIAQDMGVSYAAVSIRLQKKRWGSCSSKGRINLNAGLLCMPSFLVRHVFIHELAHLTHLNHSAAFWQEVQRHEPDYVLHRTLLKKYAVDVPAWLNHAFTVDTTLEQND